MDGEDFQVHRDLAQLRRSGVRASDFNRDDCMIYSLPQFVNFKLFGNTILVVNIKFVFVGHPLSK